MAGDSNKSILPRLSPRISNFSYKLSRLRFAAASLLYIDLIKALMLGLLCLPFPLEAKSRWEKDWIALTTPNFVIFSELDLEDTSRLGNELEAFRSIVISLTNMAEASIPKTPVYITIFKNHFKDLGFQHDISGVFIPALRARHMLVFGGGKNWSRHVIQHEYTHFLLRNHSSVEYPTWLDEGFSEFLATVKVTDNYFTYGDVNKNRADWLRYSGWKPFDKIIQIEDTKDLQKTEKAMFYAQSWALVHYLLLGREEADFKQQNVKYLQLRKQGLDKITAFENAYELPLNNLYSKVRKYLKRDIRYFKFPLNEPLLVDKSASTRLAPEFVANHLGTLCLATANYAKAGKYFNAALEYNANNAKAHAGLGDVYKFNDEFEPAERHFEKAMALEPDNALHFLDYAEYFMYRAIKTLDAGQRLAYYDRSKTYFLKSLALDDDNPETLVYYAETLLRTSDNKGAALEKALKAHRILPSSPGSKLILAEAYITMGFERQARSLLKTILGWSHSPAVDAASKLMRRIDPEYTKPAEP